MSVVERNGMNGVLKKENIYMKGRNKIETKKLSNNQFQNIKGKGNRKTNRIEVSYYQDEKHKKPTTFDSSYPHYDMISMIQRLWRK